MGSLSKICATCRKCRFVDTCQNKLMEAYAYIEKPVKAGEESVNVANSLLQSANNLNLAEAINRIDPYKMYIGTDLEGLDPFERQLRRFKID